MASTPAAPFNPINEDDVRAAIAADAAAAAEEEARKKREEQDDKLVTRWKARLEHARAHDKDARDGYVVDRKYARGETQWLVDTNLIGAIIEILMAFIYAKDPDVSVKPSSSVGTSRIQQMTLVARTIETVLSRLMKQARLKLKAKRWLRSAMTVGAGWLKVAMQTRTEIDPVMESRINTLQENLKMLQSAQAALAAGDVGDEDVAAAQIRSELTALQANKERTVAEGALIDYISAEDVTVAPECGELENYLESPWIAFDAYKSREETMALTDWDDSQESRDKLKSANVYMQRERKGSDNNSQSGTVSSTRYMPVTQQSEAESQFGFLKIVEIWSLTDGMVYTLIEGVKCWARQPYAPTTGARFYPGFLLGFHFVDGMRHPQSDVHLLRKLQDEFGRTRSNFAEHRRRAIAAVLFDKTVVDSDSVSAITAASQQEYIGITTTNGQPLSAAFFPKPYAPVDPALYSTEHVRTDMEKMSGAQDAQQGSIAVQKTLGEAEIAQSGFQARTGVRKDSLEDVLSDMSEYLAQVALQLMDSAAAVKLAGPEAVWAQLSVEEAHTLFDIEVKAGSTGKPSKNMDKQTWATLLPIIEQFIDRIGQARIKGEEWAAKPWIAVLRETAMRLDDKIDVDALLPVPPPPQPGDNAPPPPTPMEEAKIKRDLDQAYLARAQGVAALAAWNLPPEAGNDPADQSMTGGALSPILAALAGAGDGQGSQPGGVAPSPLIPDPGAAAGLPPQ